MFKAVPENSLKLDYLNLANPETYKLDKSHIASRSRVKNEFSKPKYTPWWTDWYNFFRKRTNNVRIVLLYKNNGAQNESHFIRIFTMILREACNYDIFL